MLIYIFRGPDRIFGFTADKGGENLPEPFRPWTHFKSLDVTRGEKQVSFDVEECLDDIGTYGFHLTDAHVRITDRHVR